MLALCETGRRVLNRNHPTTGSPNGNISDAIYLLLRYLSEKTRFREASIISGRCKHDKENPGIAMAMNLLGTRVVRGQDWEWGNQDGGEGFVGTVAQVEKDKKSPATAQLVYVQWDCGGKHDYRAGKQGKHDLRVFCLTNGGE